jgi:hypothetical protein
VHTVVENGQTSLYIVSANGTGGAWSCPQLADVTDQAWSLDGTQVAVLTQWQKIGHHDVHSFVSVCNASGARQIAEIPNAATGIAWMKEVDYDRILQEKDPTGLLKFSAVMYADRVTTPLLILHGEADLRVPTFQGREYYVLLAERGKTVRMGDVSRFTTFSEACRAAARCVEGSRRLAESVRSVRGEAGQNAGWVCVD